jgi:hypothetical protein
MPHGYDFARWAYFHGIGAVGFTYGAPKPLEAAPPAHYEGLVRLDREVTRTDRGTLLRRLFAEQPGAVRVVRQNGQVAGYLTERQGTQATQIGPCVGTAEAGSLPGTSGSPGGPAEPLCRS